MVIVTDNDINAIDPNASTQPSDLTITVSNVEYGHFERAIAPGYAISTFSQLEINEGVIHFVPDGSNNAPSFSVSVSNPQINSPSRAVTITFHHAPILGSNRLTIRQGASVVVTSQDLNATDVETPAPQLLFMASSIQHGVFVDVSGAQVTSFYQQEIINQHINFTSDGSFVPPFYDIAVDDGNMTITPQPALIDFIPKNTETNTTSQASSSTIRNAIIGASISGAASWDLCLKNLSRPQSCQGFAESLRRG